MARVFTRGGWGSLLVPLVLVLGIGGFIVFFLGDDREAEEAPPVTSAILVPTFERLPSNPALHYELWERRPDGGEQRIGSFRILEGGSLVTLSGDVVSGWPLTDPLLSGTELFVTIEPGDTLAEARGPRVILRGLLRETAAELEPVLPSRNGRQVALLASPTDPKAAETAGLWFARGVSGDVPAGAGLVLPRATEGWTYAAWILTGSDTLLPIGRFPDPTKKDQDNPFAGTGGTTPQLPGEDFLRRAVKGVRFPLNLADGKTHVLVSLEPDILERPGTPFLTLLRTRIPFQQAVRTPFTLEEVESTTFPRGSVIIERHTSSTDSVDGL